MKAQAADYQGVEELEAWYARHEPACWRGIAVILGIILLDALAIWGVAMLAERIGRL